MRPRVAGRTELLRLLAAGLPEAGPFPLRSHDPDPGLFGPSSVTWRVMREPLLILGASRALLMQVAHPLVAQGALDHSDFHTDPIGRFQRTVAWVTVVVYGTTEEAHAATRDINLLHRKVVGELPQAHRTEAWPAGTHYQARDRQLLRWVHASLLHAMLDTHRVAIGPLPAFEQDRFVREWDVVAQLMGLPEGGGWAGAREMLDWVEQQVTSGVSRPGPGSREVADVILTPRLGGRGPRGLAELTGFITAGLLSPAMRQQLNVTWTPAHALAHATLCRALRRLRPLLPRELRISPVYDFAMARVSGRLTRDPLLREAFAARLRVA